jgi:hypothetical protein
MKYKIFLIIIFFLPLLVVSCSLKDSTNHISYKENMSSSRINSTTIRNTILLKEGVNITLSNTKEYKLDSWGNLAPKLIINLPKEFEISKKKGEDFDVYYLRNIKKNSTIGIYIGFFPDTLSDNEEFISYSDRFNGETIIWKTQEINKEGVINYYSEALIQKLFSNVNDGTVRDLLVHIFISTTTETQLNELQQYSHTLRIVQ